jgi:hypothetical protein
MMVYHYIFQAARKSVKLWKASTITTTASVADIWGITLAGDFFYGVSRSGHIVCATVFAGSSGSDGYVDGTGGAARFERPVGIAIDHSDQFLYVSDQDSPRLFPRHHTLCEAGFSIFTSSPDGSMR